MNQRVLTEIDDERKRQDEQWGGPAQDDQREPMDFFGFVGDQCEKVGRALLARGKAYQASPDFRQRFVKVAALCVAALESIDRRAEAKDGLQ